jgi:hypothetical protein
MKWVKKGLIFVPNNNYEWMTSHASIPIARRFSENAVRIYFGTRDRQGRSHPSYIEVEADDPENVLYVHDKPVLSLGRMGTFDDNGIMPSWITNYNDSDYFYYIGWNPQITVSYRLSIGLAISKDGGRTFKKYSEGPICDRDMHEPYFNTAPCVLYEPPLWRMWYVSCTGWADINGHPEPHYHIKYSESKDGIQWCKPGRNCIDYDDFTQAIGRPCVFFHRGKYRMLYSHRRVMDYRVDPNCSYRLGYAESADGISWTRKDREVGIERSRAGWDSEMMEYCCVYEHGGTIYLLYNGNGFGKSGFGYAVLNED